MKCVPEKLPLKKKVMEQIEAAAPEDTIIASNSSSYTGSEILAGLTLKNDRRVLSAHTCESDFHIDYLVTDRVHRADWPPETSGKSQSLWPAELPPLTGINSH